MDGASYRGKLVDVKFELEEIENKIRGFEYQIEILETERKQLEQQLKEREATTMDIFALLREQRRNEKK